MHMHTRMCLAVVFLRNIFVHINVNVRNCESMCICEYVVALRRVIISLNFDDLGTLFFNYFNRLKITGIRSWIRWKTNTSHI